MDQAVDVFFSDSVVMGENLNKYFLIPCLTNFTYLSVIMTVVTGQTKKIVQRNQSAVHQMNLNVMMDVAYHSDGNVIRNRIVTAVKMRKIAVTLEITIVNAMMMNIHARTVDVF